MKFSLSDIGEIDVGRGKTDGCRIIVKPILIGIIEDARATGQ